MQPSLFESPSQAPFDADPLGTRAPRAARFDGPTFAAALDGGRLLRQLDAVRQHTLACGAWQTLGEIAQSVGLPDSACESVSARLRDLRKPRFGAFIVDRRRRTVGIWEYRVTRSEVSAA